MRTFTPLGLDEDLTHAYALEQLRSLIHSEEGSLSAGALLHADLRPMDISVPCLKRLPLKTCRVHDCRTKQQRKNYKFLFRHSGFSGRAGAISISLAPKE